MAIYFNFFTLQRILFLLSLFALPSLGADQSFSITCKQAERLFSEKLYGDALSLYSQLVNSPIEEELKRQLSFRLAACYLEEGQPQKALSLLYPFKSTQCQNQFLYLMSLAYRQLGESSRALDLLQQCSNIQNSRHAEILITLEQGYHYLLIGDHSSAQRTFEKIPQTHSDSLSYYLAQLNLVKIYLLMHKFETAHQILFQLGNYLPQEHLLNIERIYLKGLLLLAMDQNSQASVCFEELLPKALSSKASWSVQVLTGLIMSYLRQTHTIDSSSNQLQILLSKTDAALQQLLIRAPTDTSYLLLNDFYLIKAKRLSDTQSYVQAQQLLERQDLFSSIESKRQALFQYAGAAPSYQERRKVFEKLANNPEYPQAFCAKVNFLMGLNDFEEGLNCQKQQSLNKSIVNQRFEQAARAFEQAFQLGKKIDLEQSGLALKYQALANAFQRKSEKVQQGWQEINQLIGDSTLLSTFEYPPEIYCLAAWIALHLADNEILQQAKVLLQQSQVAYQSPTVWKERCLKLEGLIGLQLEQWKEADLLFAQLLQEHPHTASHAEVLFWLAYSADKQQKVLLKKEYLHQVYTQYPQNAFAPIAYFQFYSYRDYMQGQRKAIKHLQVMPLLFPLHPLLINAYYLLGLNYKKDRLSEDGQISRRKDWTAAIDAFQSAESTFEYLFEKNLIPSTHLLYFIQVRDQAQLERAQANLAIAQTSIGGKRQIYLEYAEEVFKQLIQNFKKPHSHAMEKLVNPLSPYPKIWAKAELKLAQIYEEKKCLKEAETILNESLEHYRQAQVTQNYELMQVWYAKGKLAQQQMDYRKALEYFTEAEKATIENVGLSPNEKLDLWIQQSLCYKKLNQLDNSMRLLSKVINHDVISPLRIKAMFLRAEIYELQERPELAIKQLEAITRKGGEWAQKAQEKLEHMYAN